MSEKGFFDDADAEINFGQDAFNSKDDAFGGSSYLSGGDEEDIFSGINEFDDNDEDAIGAGEKGVVQQKKALSKASKTALLAILAGIVLLIIVGIIIRAVSNSSEADGKSKKDNIEHSSNVEEVVNVTATPTVTVSINSNTNVSNMEEWVHVANVDISGVSDVIASSMTVTEVKGYGRNTGVSNDKQLKSVVRGAIDGLSGTYDIVIPYSLMGKVGVGTKFAVEYRLMEYNGYKVVIDLDYIR